MNHCLDIVVEEVTRLKRKWTIDHFKRWYERNGTRQELSSPEFKDEQFKWILNLRLELRDGQNVLLVNPKFHLNNPEGPQLKANIRFSIHFEGSYGEINRDIPGVLLDDYMDIKLFNETDLKDKNMKITDKLTIKCKIDITKDSRSFSGASKSYSWLHETDILKHNIIEFFNRGDHSDVTINVHGRQFKAHKAILAARSPILKQMLTGNLNTLELADEMHPNSIEEMLKFIYEDRSSLESDGGFDETKEALLMRCQLAVDTMKVAHKYQVIGLKFICEHFLQWTFLNDDVWLAEMLLLAHSCKADKLKASAIKLVLQNPSRFIQSDGWKKLIAEAPTELVGEIFACHVHPIDHRIDNETEQMTRIELTWELFNFKDHLLKEGYIFSQDCLIKLSQYFRFQLVLHEQFKGGGSHLCIRPIFATVKRNTGSAASIELSRKSANGSRELVYHKIYIDNSQDRGLVMANLNKKSLDMLCPDDRLTIHCKLEFIKQYKRLSGELEHTNWWCKNYDFGDNLNELYVSQQFSDVTIRASGQEFKVHKVILAARSPVFKMMFANDMKENRLNRVDIDDIEPDVLEELIRFIYTGRSSLQLQVGGEQEQEEEEEEPVRALDRQQVVELFKASDKYQLDGLKSICGESLMGSSTCESILETLVLADTYNCPDLKSEVEQFMITNIDEIDKTDLIMTFLNSPDGLYHFLKRLALDSRRY